MKRLHWVLLAMLLPGLALAVEKGSTLEPWTLQDQFEKAHSLDDSTRVLLVARDMDGSKLVKAALAERPKGYLEGAPRAVPGGHQPHAGADFPAFRGAGHA